MTSKQGWVSTWHPIRKIAEYKRKYYNIGKTEAEKNLERKVKAKQEELLALQKPSNADKQQVNKLQNELAALKDDSLKID
ncbi:MAG: hypothetical protein IPM82_11850 [Saprospiraceae bacterium]|nr:hypothetical protein [Saprospiraceae bacterium]